MTLLVDDGRRVPRNLGTCRPSGRLKALLPRAAQLGPGVVQPRQGNINRPTPPIFDQGRLGSCVWNGIARAAAIVDGLPHGTVYSRLFGYATTRWLEDRTLNRDDGVSIAAALVAWTQYGCCLEEFWHYIDDGDYFKQMPDSLAFADAEKHQPLLFFSCPTPETIKQSILDGFPVIVGMPVPRNMMTDHAARTGMVYAPVPEEEIVGNHLIEIDGFDDDKSFAPLGTKGGFCCANSWGEAWGQGGYFWMDYEFMRRRMLFDAVSIRRIEVP